MSYSSEVLADSPIAYWRLGEIGVVAMTASSSFSGQPASQAFDGSTATAWNTAAGATGWVQVQYGTAFVVTQYTLSGGAAALARAPKDWTFQGSNNGSSWTTLDTRTGFTAWTSQNDQRVFTFSNSTAYSYYRLDVTANNGDSYMNVTELIVLPNAGSAVDASGNSRTGTYANLPTLGVAGALAGDSDTAAQFTSASSQQMQAAYWSGLNLTTLTLECWVKTTGANQAIMSRAGGSAASYAMFVDIAGKLQFVIKTNSAGSAGTNYTGTVTINDGNWHHVACVRDNATAVINLYVDGVLDSTFTSTSAPYALRTDPIVIASRGSAAPYLNGTVDEAAIYNTALSATRIGVHYSTGAGTGPQTVAGGRASEADSALTGSAKVGKVVSGGLASEADSALTGSTTVGKVVVGGRASETDTALTGSLATGLLIPGGQATETDSARAGSVVAGAVVVGGQALETDTALAGTLLDTQFIVGGRATETDTALTGTVIEPSGGTTVVGGRATEFDTVLRGTITYSYFVGDTSNRANGLSLGGTMPLTFEPAVDPAPARAAKRRIIAATAFDNLDVTGTQATYDVVTRHKRRLRERVVMGGKDITYINGAETTVDYQLVSPLLYGPGTVTVPGIKTPFRTLGKGTLKWCGEFATVKVQMVNDDDEVVHTLYKGLVTAWNIDGTDVTFQLGGEAAGRAAMDEKPLPVYGGTARAGRLMYNLIHGDLGLPFKPFLGPDSPDTLLPRVGASYIIDAIEHIGQATQKRDGTQFAAMPDADGDYRFEAKDRTTIHATVYVDGTRVRANVRRDMAEEHNAVYVNTTTPEGRRLSGTVMPGIVSQQPAWGGSNLSEGDVGGQVPVLINRLRSTPFLDRGEGEGFDADVTEAVQDIQERAGLPVTGVVDHATWNAVWSLEVTGYSLKMAHREPVAAQSRVERWLKAADGSIIGRNPNFDPRWPRVTKTINLTQSSARTRQRVGRAELHTANDENWVGTIEVTTGAVIQGEHNPGDPFTLDDLMDTRLLKPGMNLWCPGFQSETGTLFHISGVDSGGQTFLVDTRGRDTLPVDDVIRRNREERRFRAGRRASSEIKDVVGEWDGAAGGILPGEIAATEGEWVIAGVPAAEVGSISRFRMETNPNAETCVAVFGGPLVPAALASYLNRKIPNPLTTEGNEAWTDHDINQHLRSKGLVVVWGGPEDPGGYDPRAKSKGGELTGVLADDAGEPFDTDRFPVLYVAVWADRDTVIPAGRIMWNQLEPGA